MSSGKKYILFDNDGVLCETEVWYYHASVRVLKELGFVLEKPEYMRIMAEGRSVWEQPIAAGFSEAEVLKARDRRNDYYQEYIRTETIEIPGVSEVIAELAGSGRYKMGVVTAARREDFELIHRSGAITKHMTFVLCEGEYARVKPHPDPYLAGLARFNAPKHEAIVVEDSERGLMSAVRAGIECVIVKNEFTKTHDFSKATHRIGTLKELEKLL
jgi:HAD superfamily hydrolase (TIGR01509 family)